jgi:hypothetical protein
MTAASCSGSLDFLIQISAIPVAKYLPSLSTFAAQADEAIAGRGSVGRGFD